MESYVKSAPMQTQAAPSQLRDKQGKHRARGGVLRLIQEM